MDLLQQALAQLLASSPWELLAVVLAVAYLLLAMKESLWCWYCAFVSTAIYTVLFWNVSLLMESALNVFYMGMAVYGWWEWKYGGRRHEGVVIHRWPARTHLAAFTLIAAITLVSGYLGKRGHHLDGGSQDPRKLALLDRGRRRLGLALHRSRTSPHRAAVHGLRGDGSVRLFQLARSGATAA